MATFQISILPIVPSLLLPLLDCSADDLKSLRFIFTGGAPANDSLISALLDKIPPGSLDVYNIYGMTEATGCISVLKISNSQKVNSGQAIGEILPFLNAKVSDASKYINLQYNQREREKKNTHTKHYSIFYLKFDKIPFLF